MNQKPSTLLQTTAGKVKGRLKRSAFFNGSRGPTSLRLNKEASIMHETRTLLVCSKCLTEHGLLYMCNSCGMDFCEEHKNTTMDGEILCDECYQGHPENVDSERIDEAERKCDNR